MTLEVDLNADLGEGAGHDAELFELISSANIATGFHAGDSDTMHAAVCAAKEHGVAVGAHPSFVDRENFGRKELKVSNEEVFDAVAYQLGIFQAVASAVGVRPNHVKPHGARYNMAVRDEKLTDAIAPARLMVCKSRAKFSLIVITWMTDGWFHGRDRMHCSVIQKRPPSASCACCAKAKCAPSKDAMSTCAAKQFAFMAIHLERSSSPVSCERNLNMKAREYARRRVCDERQDQHSAREDRPCPRAWADRRHDDRDGLDDRFGHLYYLSGIVAVERSARLAAACMGYCRFAHHHRRVVLLGACDHDAAGRRCLCFFARSVRPFRRILVWLDVISCDSNWNHRCGRDRVRKVPRRFCYSGFAGQLPGCANLVRRIRDQLVDGTTGGDCINRVADVDEHARA